MEKTTRILRLFEMLMDYQEFTLAEGAETFGVSRRTVCRDLRLLSQAGAVRCRWSKQLGAFIPGNARLVPSPADEEELIPQGEFVQDPFLPPRWPEGRTQRLYMEKIIRLCTLRLLMMGEEDPIAWYRGRYPALSDRTRQRDFQALDAAGWGVRYVSARDSWDGEHGYWQYDCFD